MSPQLTLYHNCSNRIEKLDLNQSSEPEWNTVNYLSPSIARDNTSICMVDSDRLSAFLDGNKKCGFVYMFHKIIICQGFQEHDGMV